MRYLMLLLLLASVAFAESSDNSSNVQPIQVIPMPTISFGQPGSYCGAVSIMDGARLVICGLAYVVHTVLSYLAGGLSWFLDSILSLMLKSLDVTMLKSNYDAMRNVALSALSVLIALLGLYWIAGARNIEGRITAKVWSERLIALIILESVGFFLLKLALGLNDYIVGSVSTQLTSEMFAFGVGNVSAVVMLVAVIYGYTTVLLTFVTLIVRQILLGALTVCFPFTLILYLTPPTKKWGSVALNLTLAVVFLGALDAILLYGGSAAVNMVGLAVLGSILSPLVFFTMLGLLGAINIYVLLMVPGLSGGVGAMTIVSGFANAGMRGIGNSFANLSGPVGK